ncbi:MAG: hypothetical protein HBSAPP04_14750 [Ignavibacteriaceae bacterium]|nr:MAG: hypothetical protein HBSAPP04_14750 [Ignavibacteriaceae bacterium]
MKIQPVKIDYKLVNKTEIARRLGLSPAYVHLIINGKKKGPKARAWMKKIIEIASDRAA